MNRGRFITGEKLREFRDVCYAKGMLLGGAVVTLGTGIGSSISTGVPHVDLFALSALLFAGSYGVGKLSDEDFDKIEETIEHAGGDME